MVTVKTPFDCTKTNKQMETQVWVFLVIFRSCESFVDPLAKEKLTWNAAGWCLRAAHQLLPCACPIHPVTPHLVLSWCWCQHQHSEANAPSQIWGRFGLKNNPAKYVCLSVCVSVWEAPFPHVIHGKAVPTSVLAGGQAGARGKQSNPRGGKSLWLILLPNIVSSEVTALDQSSRIGAYILHLSKAGLWLHLCLF